MKNLFFCLTVALTFSACQRSQYANIPAPKFEHFEQKNAATALNAERAEPQPTASESLPATAAETQAISNTEVLVVSNNSITITNPKANATKKPTFKQRLVAKVVARKMQKMQKSAEKSQMNTLALLSGISGILGVLLLVVFPLIGLALALFAIIGGFVSRSQVKKSGERGIGWSIAGIALGFLVFFFVLLGILLLLGLIGNLSFSL